MEHIPDKQPTCKQLTHNFGEQTLYGSSHAAQLSMAEVHWGALETTLKSIIRNLLYEVMAMFDKEYSFKGIHADKVNELTKDFDNIIFKNDVIR